MAALVSCPDEILCRIFQSITSISDLQNLMLSCRRFLHVIRNSNKLWRLKLTVVKNVRETLKKLSPLCYPMEDPPLAVMDKLIVGDSPMPEFVEEELLNQIFRQKTNENLTISFHAQKVLRYLRAKNLEKNWVSYNLQPIHNRSLLEGIVMISQWVQMEKECLVSLEEVECAIGNIVNRVRQIVNAKSNDSHAKTDVNDPEVARKIFAVMKNVLYKEMQFSCVEIGEDLFSFQNMCVEKVLQVRCGLSLVLLVIYHEIAKRMGILCVPVFSFDRILLRHTGSPSKVINYTFIDPSTGYYFPGFAAFVSSVHEIENVLTDMVEHFLEYLDSGYLDKDGIHVDRRRAHIHRLACAISRYQEISWITDYTEMCANLRIQLEETIQMLECKGLQDLAVMKICKQIFTAQRASVSEIFVFHRLPLMKYAVGLVMKYKGKEDFPQLGVINLSGMTREDINSGNIVPYYCVLFDGGQDCCWVPEDDLELLPGGAVIKHSQIGLHFERFDGRRYVLNATTNALNPGNEEFVLTLLGFCDFARLVHNLCLKNSAT
ncbi:uncharacterized protein LOC124196199 [Daphnia pulex]|uniref:uncharacterized protein LOC124196199 n=1 Tax=Daphnia pulex TaxID=6669 RepID=UPI001EE03743|nr:uncharacterized protein LOC124196199 [Daphnia pulex]